MRNRNKLAPYFGVAAVVIIAILLGVACGRVRAEDSPLARQAWEQLTAELMGQEPANVALPQLNAAMVAVIERSPELSRHAAALCFVIACHYKVRPKESVMFLLFHAVAARPEFGEDFIEIAKKICPNARPQEKVVLPRSDIEEDLSTPLNFAGITPPSTPFTPITEVQDHRR